MAGLIDKVSLDHSKSVFGRRRDPVYAFRFQVTIEGLYDDYGIVDYHIKDEIGFSRITGLGSEIETEDVIQGTRPTAIQIPRRIRYSEVEFSWGLTERKNGLALMKWFRDTKALLFNAGSGEDAARDTTRGEQTILRLRRRHITIIAPPYEILLVNAWPTKGTFGDLDANASQVWIHSMTIRHNGIQVKLQSPPPEGPTEQ